MELLIEAEELKTNCLELLEQVAEQGETLVITRDGQAVARVVALCDGQLEAGLLLSDLTADDIVLPIEGSWES
jgi:antitoxin (DNA-binding transcriptional repressor) of toxin-antitoxin stability system